MQVTRLQDGRLILCEDLGDKTTMTEIGLDHPDYAKLLPLAVDGEDPRPHPFNLQFVGLLRPDATAEEIRQFVERVKQMRK